MIVALPWIHVPVSSTTGANIQADREGGLRVQSHPGHTMKWEETSIPGPADLKLVFRVQDTRTFFRDGTRTKEKAGLAKGHKYNSMPSSDR